MGSELSITSRAEGTSKSTRAYAKVSKYDNGVVLDVMVDVAGWSRDNARRRLTAVGKTRPGSGRQVVKGPRRRRRAKCSYDARKVLQQVWAACRGQCGGYEAVATLGAGLERHGELIEVQGRYSAEVRPSCWL